MGDNRHSFGVRIGKKLRRRFSPLTLRIMAVNVLALAILGGAVLYLSRYQDRLIEVELEALMSEARIFSGALAEGATMQGDNELDRLVPPLARQMVRRLDEVTEARTRLYDYNGKLLADSWVIGSVAGERVWRERLPEPSAGNIMTWAVQEGARALKYLTPNGHHWPPYNPATDNDRNTLIRTNLRDELQSALDGAPGMQVYETPGGHMLFSVAVPIARYKQVLGVMNLTRSGQKVEQAIATVRLDILKIFTLSLAITILLSLYLARAISRPIQRLADAADQVRTSGDGRRREIPDFTGRRDEIGELSGSLRAMTDALWQRMDAIESFAADVAHELKNPLASLRSAIETLDRVKDPAQQEKLRGIIHYDVIRLDRLITDISGASRLDAELSRVEMQPIAVARLLTTLVDLYAYQEHAAGRVVLGEMKGKLLTVGVEGRLVQVLQNVIDNAITFSPPLDAETGRGTVRVEAERIDNKLVRITVNDDGPGIPEGKLAAIFDRFYSERPADETFGQHSGLGLSIAKQIIDAHNGRIYARNRLDAEGRVEGATFTVDLPAA